MADQKVQVYIYDLSKGLARSMSVAFLGKQLDGIWHTGIVAYGQEFYYGGMGIEGCAPGGTILGQPDYIHDLGTCEIPFEIFMDYLKDLASTTFRPESYHLLNHNCNTFSNEVAQFLTGNPIPAHITNLPQEVLSTPFGAMIKPFIDAMSVSPEGGHQLFSPPSTPAVQPPPAANAHTKPQVSSMVSKQPSSSEETPVACQTSTKPLVTNVTKTNHADTAVAASNPGDQYQKPKLTPVIHHRTMTDAVLVQTVTSSDLERKTKDLLLEIHEYISTPECSWSLGRPHTECASSLVHHDTVHCVATDLLAEAVKSDDVLQVVTVDPKLHLLQASKLLDSMTTEQQTGYTKVLCNLCACIKGRDYLLSSEVWKCGDKLVSNLSVVTKISVQGILSDNSDLQGMASSLALNLSIAKLSAETALELGGALIQHLMEKDPPITRPDTVYNSLEALHKCMEISTEVAALADVMGLDVMKFKDLNEKTKEICTSVSQIMSS